MANQNVGYNGIGFSGLLAIVFIVLKFLNVITWSWLWVLSPIWIPLAFGLGVLLIWLIVMAVGVLFAKKRHG